MGSDNNRGHMISRNRRWTSTVHGSRTTIMTGKIPNCHLGYIKIGQVDLQRTFGSSATFKEIYETMSKNLNITSIKTMSNRTIECEYPYTLDSDDWQQIQMESLRQGYESRSMR